MEKEEMEDCQRPFLSPAPCLTVFEGQRQERFTIESRYAPTHTRTVLRLTTAGVALPGDRRCDAPTSMLRKEGIQIEKEDSS
jgi:hypothetical protein